ncbi:MAG: alanine/glycine:cation symporter family protein [Pseudomonadota bacterium]
MTIDAQIDEYFAPVAHAVDEVVFYTVPMFGQDVRILILWLLLPALVFTFYLGFVNFKHFWHGIQVALGKYDEAKDDGQISSFQALMASLSGTVGLGNIAGVAIAVSVGGPGAVFWMIFMGVMSMSTKFAEVTLGMLYRLHPSKKHPDRLAGGPMYYLRDGFKKKGHPLLGQFLAITFAIFCILGAFGGGNMFQANQAFQQVYQITGAEAGFFADRAWVFGIILAFLTGVVIIGGIKSIANVASKIVPFMGIMYVIAALVVIGLNYPAIPGAFVEIFRGAINVEAGIGGLIGALIVGVQRAAFSNEAGIGTAAIVYSAARAKHPAMQGMASMIGPFLDTVVICSTTALLILVTGVHENADGIAGVELTSAAFATGISWFPYVLAVAVCLFAYSTLITFAYYGEKAVNFLFGESDALELLFKILFCLFVVVGSSVELHNIIELSDALILAMAIPNVIGMYVLAPEVKSALNKYLKIMKLDGTKASVKKTTSKKAAPKKKTTKKKASAKKTTKKKTAKKSNKKTTKKKSK